MGMRELRPSLAPRNQMKRTFLPWPIVPSAKARFITIGMSTSVDRATARLAFAELLRKLRRVIRFSLQLPLECRIKLLFLETLQCHEHGHHATDASIVNG